MICLPFLVPFTLQTFALYFIIYTFGARTGLVTAVVYTAIGAVGLPVFSGFSGGFGRIFEPTGGFILGFIAAAAVYLISEALLPALPRWLPTLSSLLSLYIFGTVFLVAFYSDGTPSGAVGAVALYVLPYVIPDVIKIVAAKVLSSRLEKYINI